MFICSLCDLFYLLLLFIYLILCISINYKLFLLLYFILYICMFLLLFLTLLHILLFIILLSHNIIVIIYLVNPTLITIKLWPHLINVYEK
jgi:hypothetical protein